MRTLLPAAAAALAVLGLCLQSAGGVDHANFKTCEQAGFCKRNRQAPAGVSPWSVLPDTVQISGDKFGVEANLRHERNGATLKLQLRSLLDDGSVLNLHLTELTSERARYEAKDALLAGIARVKLNLLESDADGFRVQFGQKGQTQYTARVNAKPFRVDVYDGERLLLTGNERGLFRFEHFRKRPAENEVAAEEDGEPTDGAWEETFKSFSDSKPYGPMSVAMDWNFVGFEHVYGIPEHADSFALKDTKGHSDPYRLYNLDVFEYELNSPMSLYGSVPMMLAHSPDKTLGLLWLNPSETWIDIESASKGLFSSQKSKNTHWISETGVIDTYIMMGPKPADVMRQNAKLTGTTPLPPYYAIGHHQCRWNYFSQDEVHAVDEAFDEHNIPVDAIWLDIEYTEGRLKKYFTWDPLAFSDPRTLTSNLTAKGRRLITIIDPHLKKDGGYEVYNEAVQNNFFIKTNEAKDYEGWCWPDASMYPDYVNPNVRDWWAKKFNPEYFPGFAGGLVDIWNDMNEPSVFNGPEVTAPKDVRHVNGWEHRDVHNMYGFLMTKSTSAGLIEHRPNMRAFILTRAFFVGSQRYCAVWTGDNMSKWEHLKAAIPMLLSLSSVGISFSGADVPGFFYNPENTELVVRWYQAGAFQPFFRAHAHIDTKRREPWTFDEQTRELIGDAIKLRYSYLPYLYTLFYENSVNGLPPLRPLWFHFDQDEATFAIDQAHLLGDALLVHPVVDSNAESVNVYLPGSDESWLHVPTSRVYHGGAHYTIPVNISTVPYFQRGGSIVPRRERMRRSAALTLHDPITVDVFLNKRQDYAGGRLYLDDGLTRDYENDQFIDGLFELRDRKFTYVVSRGKLHSQVQVERIRFYNYPRKPSQISGLMGDRPIQLHFFYDEESQLLTIRKPELNLATHWSFELK